MSSVIVIGGGLAGLATAAALGGAGYRVDLYESRGFLGGRATSYNLPNEETIDNCQHVLLRCCVNLLDFYSRLGVRDLIDFSREFYWVEPGGRTSTMSRGLLPKPLHFAESFFRLTFLDWADKIGIGRALLAIERERGRRKDLDRITMLDWLREKKQSQRAIDRFWNQVLVSAINEDLGRMAASHGFQVFYLGFLAKSDTYEMGVPSAPLGELYGSQAWQQMGNVHLHLKQPVDRVLFEHGRVTGVLTAGSVQTADAYVLAVPFERVAAMAPELDLDVTGFEHSPITGIHLWFDRAITTLPHATLLDRTVQWMFNKHEGRYVQLVVSASRSLTNMPRGDVISLGLKELAEFFPTVRDAKLEKAHVVKEIRATFSAKPDLEASRPLARTRFPNLVLSGDWTRSGWPATMEGAVRSGYLAAEEVTRAVSRPENFLLPDVA